MIMVRDNHRQSYCIIKITKLMGNAKSQHVSNCQLHPRLGEVRLLDFTDSQGNILPEMEITKLMESEKIFTRWMKDSNKIDDSMTRQVLLLPNKTVYESTGLCGSNGIARLKYEYYPYVFQTEILNRRNISRFFLQTELWYLLYNLIRAGSKFQKYHSKIGDVHPMNILINDDGLIKLISTCSYPGEENNFDKFIENAHAKVYLAPEEIEHTLQRTQYPKNVDPSIAECYSIGLCMLAAGTLEDIDSIYDNSHQQRRIQRHKVNYYLKLFGQKYSSYLHQMVMSLLIENPVERKKCSQIYATLYEFQDRILDLQSFMPNNSRLAPYQPQHFMTNSQSQRLSSQISQGKPDYLQSPVHSRNHSNNIYYNPGIIVNPIQSKYIPMSNVTSQPMPMMMQPVAQYIPEGNRFRQMKRL